MYEIAPPYLTSTIFKNVNTLITYTINVIVIVIVIYSSLRYSPNPNGI